MKTFFPIRCTWACEFDNATITVSYEEDRFDDQEKKCKAIQMVIREHGQPVSWYVAKDAEHTNVQYAIQTISAATDLAMIIAELDLF